MTRRTLDTLAGMFALPRALSACVGVILSGGNLDLGHWLEPPH